MIDAIKAIVLAIIEGITEFLPISSTGHLILANQWIGLQPQEFANAFSVIIQLGAILAVVVLYFDRLNPWSSEDPGFKRRPRRYETWNTQTKLYYRATHVDQKTVQLWLRVIVAVLPAVVLGLLFDDLIDQYLMTLPVVACTLLLYGVLMILLERWNQKRQTTRFETPAALDYKTAFLIGCFQCLALIPGTSRSAATIIGAMLLGTSRVAAAEFSFFLAIPTMLGATALKIIKNLGGLSGGQWLLILLGFVVSFVVAYLVIRRFMDYIRRHDFTVFGYYRIALAALLLIVGIAGLW